MTIRPLTLLLLAGVAALAGCETAYYSAMDKVGFAKRDILASRVASARDSQVEAQVNQLVAELNEAIAEANRFIADLEQAGG